MFKKLFAPVDLTNGKIYKVILVFMIPILISYIFQQIYTLTDAIIVGQNLSANEVNGVNDVGSITYIILQFAFGCSAGFSVISSEKMGQKDHDGLRLSFLTQVILGFIIAVFLTILATSLLDPLLSLVGLTSTTGGATYEAAKTYLLIIFLGTICQVAYNQICSLLLFIVVFHWGVAGAAIATIIAQGISALLCYIYTFVKYPFLRFKSSDFKALNWSFYAEHLKLGLPLALQFSILGIGLITLQSTIIKFDTTIAGVVIDNGPAQLAYGAANKMQNFLMTPLNALGTAMLSFCGQNHGAKLYKRVKKGIITSITLMFIIYVLLFAIALLLLIDNTYMKLFYDASKITDESAYLGRLSVLSTVPFFPLLGILFILRCSIQGIGKPVIPFFAGIGELLARTLLCLFGPYMFVDQISTSLNLYENPAPFITTCLADPFAWLIACLILGIGYFIFIHKQYKKLVLENNTENLEITSQN